MNTVHVLMSTYNGKEFVKQQIESILLQKDVNVRITIRDDGSNDGTVEEIAKICDSRIELIIGENIGFAQSFWSLVQETDCDSDYYAFSDQDDYWLSDKLSTAVTWIKKTDNTIPVLYTGNAFKANKDLIVKSNEGLAFNCDDVLCFPECLKISKVPGCTYVFNRSLKRKLREYSNKMIAHDWTAYIIANAIGIILYDETPHMYYRIHETNTVGIENKVTTLKKRLKRLTNPEAKNARSFVAAEVLRIYRNEIPDDKANVLKEFSEYRKCLHAKIQLLKHKEYHELAFALMVILNRL